jgi:hypothetical protein
MMPLTSEDIRIIFDKIGRETLVHATDEFPFDIVSIRSQGYHSDPVIGRLQAKLGMMLQVAADREEKAGLD